MFTQSLITLYLLALLVGSSLGLFNPLMSTFMEQQQTNSIWIGATSTAYFLAIALMTVWVKKRLEKWGISKVLCFGLGVAGLIAPLFPLTTQLPLWFLIRFVMGWGVCCFLVSGQTALNHFSKPAQRASVSGFYFLALGLGFMIGSVVGPRFYAIAPTLAFGIGGAVLFLGLAVASYGLPKTLRVSLPKATPQFSALKKIGLPLHGIFSYGIAEATLITLYPVFLLRQNYNLNQMGTMLAVFVIGSIISTLPVTVLADRFGKIRILFLSVLTGLIAILGLVLVTPYAWLLGFSFLGGASIGPVYPLCLALVGERLPQEELPAGTALFTTTYSLGNAAGPIFSSLLMELMGSRYLFSICIPLFAVLLVRLQFNSRPFAKKAVFRY